MQRFSTPLHTFFKAGFHTTIALCVIFKPNLSVAVNKCELNGKITYTDQACEPGANALPYSQHASPAGDPVAAQQRYLADKKKLDQINKQKAQEEKQNQHDAQVYENKKKQLRDQELNCKNMDLNRQLASQHQSEAKLKGNSKQIKKSQLQTQKAENNYVKACKTE